MGACGIFWDSDSEISRLDSAFCESSPSSCNGGGDGVVGGFNGNVWGGGGMRACQSDSSLARWKSFEALNRRGLSDTALGLPRVVGTSRLLKFFQPSFDASFSRSSSSTPTPSEFCVGKLNEHKL